MLNEASDPHILGAGMAPTPFTADEIREGCPPGRTMRIRVETDGIPPFLRVTRFVRCDDEGATTEQSRLSVDGSPLDEPSTARVSWQDLQAHASFPVDRTTIEPERLTTPLGELDCLRYTVSNEEDVDVFWFAKALPGMPIHYQTRVNGEIVSTITVVANAYR